MPALFPNIEPSSLVASPSAVGVEGTIQMCVEWLRLGIEVVGAAIIGFGVLMAVARLIRTRPADFNAVRLGLARFLALALEFQLGADILSTAIAPSWDKIGKLGAIAIIRTALNFFLMREMEHERVDDVGRGAVKVRT